MTTTCGPACRRRRPAATRPARRPPRPARPAPSKTKPGRATPGTTTPGKTGAPSASSAESSPEATETASGRDERPKVDILNQSAGQGAAEQTADLLREAGWRVGRVDDFRGTVRATTVYYLDDDLRRDAKALARDLPGPVRVLEGFSTLSDKRLSVVLVD